jgi:hypothetical protein
MVNVDVSPHAGDPGNLILFAALVGYENVGVTGGQSDADMSIYGHVKPGQDDHAASTMDKALSS